MARIARVIMVAIRIYTNLNTTSLTRPITISLIWLTLRTSNYVRARGRCCDGGVGYPATFDVRNSSRGRCPPNVGWGWSDPSQCGRELMCWKWFPNTTLCPPIEKVGCAMFWIRILSARRNSLGSSHWIRELYHINWTRIETGGHWTTKTLDYHRRWWNHTIIENGHNRRPHLTYLK